MAIILGNKAIVSHVDAGVYPADIKEIKETDNVTLKKGGTLPAIIIDFNLEIGGKFLTKEKKYIASDKPGSELRALIEALIPEADFETGVNLEDLIGKSCKVTVIENISSTGNRFTNISTIKADIDE